MDKALRSGRPEQKMMICFRKSLTRSGGAAPGPPEFTLFAYKVMKRIDGEVIAAHYFIGLAIPLKVALQRCLYPVRKQKHCIGKPMEMEC